MKVLDLIRSRMEPSEPQDTILTILRKHDGKRINKRHVEEIAEAIGDPDVRLRKQFGMAMLEWGRYGMTNCEANNGSLLLAHTEVNVVIDVDYILRHGCAYFSAKDDRNALREEALADPAKCKALDAAIKAKLEADAVLKSMLDLEIFGPDDCTINRVLVEGGEL